MPVMVPWMVAPVSRNVPLIVPKVDSVEVMVASGMALRR
jgi:hypothetical protein